MARKDKATRQKEIIDEALKIIHKQGYKALTIKELSKKVRISEPAIYRHFRSKEDIILGILHRIEVFEETLRIQLLETDKNELPLNRFVKLHLQYFESNPEITSIIFSEDIFRESKRLSGKLLKIIGKRRKIVQKMITDCNINKGKNGLNPGNLSTIILGFIRLLVLEWRLSGFKYSLSQKGEEGLKTLTKLIYAYKIKK